MSLRGRVTVLAVVVVLPLLAGAAVLQRVSLRAGTPAVAELEKASDAARDRVALLRGRARLGGVRICWTTTSRAVCPRPTPRCSTAGASWE